MRPKLAEGSRLFPMWQELVSKLWRCACLCGMYPLVSTEDLKKTRSCGCLRDEAHDVRRKVMAGYKFNMLTAVRKVDNAKNGAALWYCVCSCKGNTGGRGYVVCPVSKMRGPKAIKSCGCIRNEKFRRAAAYHQYTRRLALSVLRDGDGRC